MPHPPLYLFVLQPSRSIEPHFVCRVYRVLLTGQRSPHYVVQHGHPSPRRCCCCCLHHKRILMLYTIACGALPAYVFVCTALYTTQVAYNNEGVSAHKRIHVFDDHHTTTMRGCAHTTISSHCMFYRVCLQSAGTQSCGCVAYHVVVPHHVVLPHQLTNASRLLMLSYTLSSLCSSMCGTTE